MTTDTINISVETTYIESQSQPVNNRYVYTYKITIKNCSDEPVQLISRQWIITDAKESRQEVKGVGVVGEQPRLEPGEEYSYTSGVIIETEIGTMEGCYQMKTDHDTMFDAPIPTFALAPPHAIH